MVKHSLTIGHIYPKQMNVYGDMGNILALKYRLLQRGIEFRYVAIDSFTQLKDQQIDILVGGGGQDSNQEVIQQDLMRHKQEIKSQCSDGLVTLLVCGMYQMFGKRFILGDQSEIQGIGVIDLETRAGDVRLIGNLRVQSPFGELVGFENHSGKTYLGNGITPLGQVLSGAGNNGEDGLEGVLAGNIIGTYMHGPILPKNPVLADELLVRALRRKYGSFQLENLDNRLEEQAHLVAANRPR